MTVGIEEDPERRLAERRDRVLKRLRASGAVAPAAANASLPAAPIATEAPLRIDPPVDFVVLVDSARNRLESLHAASQGRSPPAVADLGLVEQLTAAAAQAKAEADLFSDRISLLSALKDPRKVQAGLEGAQREAAEEAAAADRLLAQATVAHEKGSVELEKLFKRQTEEIRALQAAVATSIQETTGAMSAAAAAAADGLLLHLNSRQEARRVEFASKMHEYKATEAELRGKRASRLEERRHGLAAAARRDHAAYDGLTAQLAQQVIKHALQLGEAKREAILAPEALSFNLRVLEERTRENREVLAELKHSANSLEAALATLRAEIAQRGGAAAEEAEKALEEAHRADEALQALLQKNRHFERADAAELKQLVALKEDSFADLKVRLVKALETIKQLGGMDLTAVAGSDEAAESAADNDPLSEAYWRTKAAKIAPAELMRRLQELEVAVRADLQSL